MFQHCALSSYALTCALLTGGGRREPEGAARGLGARQGGRGALPVGLPQEARRLRRRRRGTPGSPGLAAVGRARGAGRAAGCRGDRGRRDRG